MQSMANREPEEKAAFLGKSDQLAYSIPSEVQPLPGNLITPMVNGEAAYPEMIAAIDSASSSIFLASYIFADDVVGDRFCKALVEAAKKGVIVRVLIDARSLFCRPPIIFKLRKGGIKVRHAILPTGKPSRWASRYHRRILTVDGRLGFSGGMTILAAHLVNAGYPNANQDVHFKIEGPVVSFLQKVFTRDWSVVTGEFLGREKECPPLKSEGNALVRPIVAGPGYGRGILESFLCQAILSARQRIDIVTPYFLPSLMLSSALAEAVKRDVLVRVFVPQHNFKIIEWGSRRHLNGLLGAGCMILAVPPPFDHSKLMTIDEDWSLIGSANWDSLSLFANAELNLEVQDALLRQQLERIISEKAERALPVTSSNLVAISRTAQLIGKLLEFRL